MITEAIRSLIEKRSFVFVATANPLGQPHIAIGEQVAFSGDSLMISNQKIIKRQAGKHTAINQYSIKAIDSNKQPPSGMRAARPL